MVTKRQRRAEQQELEASRIARSNGYLYKLAFSWCIAAYRLGHQKSCACAACHTAWAILRECKALEAELPKRFDLVDQQIKEAKDANR